MKSLHALNLAGFDFLAYKCFQQLVPSPVNVPRPSPTSVPSDRVTLSRHSYLPGINDPSESLNCGPLQSYVSAGSEFLAYISLQQLVPSKRSFPWPSPKATPSARMTLSRHSYLLGITSSPSTQFPSPSWTTCFMGGPLQSYFAAVSVSLTSVSRQQLVLSSRIFLPYSCAHSSQFFLSAALDVFVIVSRQQLVPSLRSFLPCLCDQLSQCFLLVTEEPIGFVWAQQDTSPASASKLVKSPLGPGVPSACLSHSLQSLFSVIDDFLGIVSSQQLVPSSLYLSPYSLQSLFFGKFLPFISDFPKMDSPTATTPNMSGFDAYSNPAATFAGSFDWMLSTT